MASHQLPGCRAAPGRDARLRAKGEKWCRAVTLPFSTSMRQMAYGKLDQAVNIPRMDVIGTAATAEKARGPAFKACIPMRVVLCMTKTECGGVRRESTRYRYEWALAAEERAYLVPC